MHINALELIAIEKALLTLCSQSQNAHIRIFSDNSTSVTYVNKMGGNVIFLNDIALRFWTWCIENGLWISASHVAGAENRVADALSRRDMNKELSLFPHVFSRIIDVTFNPDIDLFASGENKQLPKYASWKYDPCATVIDAFSISWEFLSPYIFPSFCLIPSILHKLQADRTRLALLVAPI